MKLLALLLLASATSLASEPSLRQKWQAEVIYQVMLDRFHDGDKKNNQNTSKDMNHYQGGDIQGLIDKLDYIQSLGATVILTNPVFHAEDYHGYSVLDHNQINPHFGTEDLFRKLVKEVHKRKMKILFDFVPNHVHAKAELFRKNPEWFRPERGTYSMNDSDLNEEWSQISFYGLKDLKQEKEEVYQYLLKSAKKWIDTGIDGFRMDAVLLIAPDFWKRFNADIKAYAGDHFLIMGELFIEQHDRINSYLPYFDGFFDFPIHYSINDALKYGRPVKHFKYRIQDDALYVKKDFIPFTFIDNHDVTRFRALLPEPNILEKMKLALSILFTIRGVPTLLYGTEIPLDNEPQLYETRFDKGRSKMVFAKPKTHPLFTTIQTLSKVRKGFNFNSTETTVLYDGYYDPIYIAYLEDDQKRSRLVVYNFSGATKKPYLINVKYLKNFPRNRTFRDLLNTKKTIQEKDGYISFQIEPYEASLYQVR